ncbi:variable surface lipoprotein promoter DNA invertase Mar [Mycoplasmopsis agalactiae]|uniref:variable surface lipoprotein promoter DNA invertase Mar n=1 Tax=Mycoplasmopsis agalactiae TaxID=2110 RepID=UPI001455EF74|nr:variable surface lipoprotein promoter DNA invertase Mar [Mycoplasmopsis agalactiae]MCE6057433.1 variable surface lipoprotein promoter DNA invertase Mar [Mycoplasmopsis agalactiae]MCE6095601.1 variable surface lipoprotein promoter DNA invertase Mar [Mycoplasmopsis agalactiae]NLS34635.1 variable surface lipoprotein promoter DNA invertase Mar [Mycoplasmopsis agalactiae]
MVETFITFCERKNLAKSTIDAYKNILMNILSVETNKHLAIMKIITNQQLKANTQRLYRQVYALYLKFSNQKKNYKDIAVLKVKPVQSIYRPVLTKAQVYRRTNIMHKDKPKVVFYKLLIRFMFETGIRIGELKTINEEDKRIYVNGKGNKDRQVFYNAETYENLKMFKDKIKTVSYITVSKAIKHFLGNEYSPHSLRRSFASFMLKKGALPKMVQRQMGHSSIATTFAYQQLDENENYRIYRKIMLNSK